MPTNKDFNNAALNNLGKVVVRTPQVSSIDNDTGQETFSDGSPENVIVVFENTEPTPTQDPEGRTVFIEARMFIKSDQTMIVDDKITRNGIDYRVLGVHVRDFAENTMFNRVDLMRI